MAASVKPSSIILQLLPNVLSVNDGAAYAAKVLSLFESYIQL